MGKLEGRRALVGGASSGMGAAIARALAAEGAKVVLAARRADKLAGVAGEIAAAGGVAIPIAVDLTDEAAVEALFARVVSELGGLDLLINSQGVAHNTPIEKLSAEEWHSVMDANLTSVFLCGREALKLMKPQGRGRIISIGSISAKSPRPNAFAYVASKYGLDGLTRAMALDGRDSGVAVSVLHPGFTATGFGPEVKGGPSRNAMDPAEIARTIVLMASIPDEMNILEAVALPLGMPFLGRG